MKKKIVIGLLIYSVIFLFSGAYIVITIESARSKLDKLITLHQVEILREHYLLQIKKVQSDLVLKGTSHARSFDTVIGHIQSMGKVIDTCFVCHHSQEVSARLDDLKHQTEEYKNALSRVLTIRANAARLAAEEERTFQIGEELTKRVSNMVSMTSVKLAEKTERALRDIAKTKDVFYVLMAFVPLLSGIFIYILIKSLTNPMNVLLAGTRKLKGGDLSYRVEGLRDEFGEMAASINEMARSLTEQMEKMRRTEQMVVVAELAAGLAHEIKNPLAGIKVAMSVLSEEASLSREDRDVLHKVVGEVARLESLMKSFLNFSKPPKPQFAPVNLNNLLNTTLAFYLKHHSLSAGPASNGIEIVKDLQPLPLTKADPMQLQQVFLNIVLNAIHAMPQGGTLTIRTAHEEGEGAIAIHITDTGKGIGKEVLDKIFQPFFTTKAKGTGLGLPICKQLIEQHGGSIGVTSSPGQGTTFAVRIPVVPPEEETAA